MSGSLIADFSYDAPGQLGLPSRSRAYSAAGVVEVQAVAYDSRGQVTQQQWVVPGSGGGTFRLDTAYNAAGQQTALTYPGGSGGQLGEVVSFGYDAIGQLTSVGGAGVQYLSGATYNAQGQPLELVNDSGANGLRRQYGYESNTQRLSVLRAGKTSPYTGLQELTYRYDNAGNVPSIVDGRNSSQRQCFQYDWLDRLTGAFTGDAACSAYSAVGVGAYSHSYGYDAIGNLTDYAGSSYTYGATNAQPHAVASAYGNSYGYDANGNQVRRTIAGVEYTLVYDYENRLVAVQQGETLIASFLYAADGNRVKGSVGGVTTVYVAGLYEQSGAASTSYYEGGAMRRSGYASSNGVFCLLTDQLKSTSIIADQAGAEAARQFFYPYGANRGGAAFSELTTKRFTGQYHEQGLPGAEGLSYYNARWYDPQLGRFTSPDTIVPKPDNPQSSNRYSYTYNNPLKYTDPTGHDPCLLCSVTCLACAMSLLAKTLEDVGVTPMLPFYGVPVVLGVNQELHNTKNQANDIEPGLALTADWYFERGEEYRVFGPDSKITKALMNDDGVEQARLKYVNNGRHDLKQADTTWHTYKFGLKDATRELNDVASKGDWSTSFLGGYNVEVLTKKDTKTASLVEFRVYNETGWQSATRLWNFSFKTNEPRRFWGPGGTLKQVYVWRERILK